MSQTNRRGELWDRRWRRRIVTIPVALISWVLVTVLSPLLALVALIADLGGRRTDIPTVRLVVLAVIYLTHELFAIVTAIPVWLMGGIGANRRRGPDEAMQRWLIRSLLSTARWLMRVRIELPEDLALPQGEVVVLSRHASMVDAILPGFLFLELADRSVHYVLKRELATSPMFDIYGHRLNNHFVERGGDVERETLAITTMAERAQPNSALVIFPEGTYATDASRERVRRSLDRHGDAAALELANGLTMLLPPKTAGALALMSSKTVNAVVVLGHVGLEGIAELSGLRRNLPARSPVTVQWWTHQIADLPLNEAERTTWLHDQWILLDQWVSDHLLRE